LLVYRVVCLGVGSQLSSDLAVETSRVEHAFCAQLLYQLCATPQVLLNKTICVVYAIPLKFAVWVCSIRLGFYSFVLPGS